MAMQYVTTDCTESSAWIAARVDRLHTSLLHVSSEQLDKKLARTRLEAGEKACILIAHMALHTDPKDATAGAQLWTIWDAQQPLVDAALETAEKSGNHRRFERAFELMGMAESCVMAVS